MRKLIVSTFLTLDRVMQAPGMVIGSGDLAQTLMKHRLVDEYRFMIHPLVLGTGKRLFQDGSPMTALRLVESMPTGTGVLIAKYQPAS